MMIAVGNIILMAIGAGLAGLAIIGCVAGGIATYDYYKRAKLSW